MDPVQTVSLFDISLPGAPDRVLAEWRGFIEFQPGETARRGQPMLLLEQSSGITWNWRAGMAPATTSPGGAAGVGAAPRS